MPKVYKRKFKEPFVIVQMRFRISERQQLKALCGELDMSIQEFIKRVLYGAVPELKPTKDPENQ